MVNSTIEFTGSIDVFLTKDCKMVREITNIIKVSYEGDYINIHYRNGMFLFYLKEVYLHFKPE